MKKTLTRAGAIGLAAATILTGLTFGPAAASAAPAPAESALPGTFQMIGQAGPDRFLGHAPDSAFKFVEYDSRAVAERNAPKVEVTTRGDALELKMVTGGYAGACYSAYDYPDQGHSFVTAGATECGTARSLFRLDPEGRLMSVSTNKFVGPLTAKNPTYPWFLSLTPYVGYALRFEKVTPAFSGEVVSTNRPARSATLEGKGVPGAQVFVNGEAAGDVDPDGEWSYAVLGLKLGKQTLTLTQQQDGNATADATVEVDLAVAPVTADVSFGSNPTTPATISGTAEAGAAIEVRDSTGKQIKAAEADRERGSWSTELPAPNAGGTQTYTVQQVIDGETNGPITVTADFGAAVSITSPKSDSEHDAGTIRFQGRGVTDGKVELRKDGEADAVGTATVTGGVWTINGVAVTDERATYTATQTGKGNNVTTSTITINPDAEGETPVVVTNPADPAAGYTPDTAFTFEGTGTTGKTITVENKWGTRLATTAVTDGTWSWTRTVMGTTTWQLRFVQDKGQPAESVAEVMNFKPNAAPAPLVVVTNPAKVTDGYTPNTSFTFRGTATAGKTITVENKWGTRIATVPATDGTWSWTRANMGTTTWQLHFVQDKGLPAEFTAKVLDFKPNAVVPAPLVVVTNPADPADGYTPNAAFTFEGTATAGKTITVENIYGTRIATVPATDGTWSWTRANMGTSTIWQLRFVQDKDQPGEAVAEVLNFGPTR